MSGSTKATFYRRRYATVFCAVRVAHHPMYVCMYVFSKHTLTFNTLRHGPRQCKQRMCSEGQTGVKHLRLPKKHIKQIELRREILIV